MTIIVLSAVTMLVSATAYLVIPWWRSRSLWRACTWSMCCSGSGWSSG